MYRDELTKASQRLEELQEQINAQTEELTALRQQVAKRLDVGSTPPRSRTRVLVAATAVGIAIGMLAGRFEAPSTPQHKRASQPVSSATSPSRAATMPPLHTASSSSSEGTPRRYPRSSDPGFRIEVADAARVEQLASLCKRSVPRTSMDSLPRGTRVLDFKTCAGCDCCLPGGEFPAAFDEHNKFIQQTGECRQCSRAWTLAEAGLTVMGGRDDNPLNGSSGLIFQLGKPARVFALHIGGGSYQSTDTPKPDYIATIIAYDENGRPVDGARATYASWAPTDVKHRLSFKDLERVLLVEACDGETIGRVDLGTSDLNLRVMEIALLPVDAQ